MTQANRRAGIGLWDATVPWEVGADLRGWSLAKELHHFPWLFLKELSVLEMIWLAPALLLSILSCRPRDEMCYQGQKPGLPVPWCLVAPSLLDPHMQSLTICFPPCSAQVRLKGWRMRASGLSSAAQSLSPLSELISMENIWGGRVQFGFIMWSLLAGPKAPEALHKH